MSGKAFFLGLAAAGLLLGAQEPQREHYESGKLKAEFSVDAEGRRHGKYVEFYESGRKRLSGSYERGRRHGEWWEYYEGGALYGKRAYAHGKPAGDVVRLDVRGRVVYRATVKRGVGIIYRDFRKAELAYERGLEEIRNRIAEIDPPDKRLDLGEPERYEAAASSTAPFAAGRLKAEYLADGLKHLNVYRYLTGVSPTVKLDDGFTDLCQHAAVVCAANGEISHTPPRPEGMDAAFHGKGYRGASSSNLTRGRSHLRAGVDAFMADLGANNLRDVGHRSWIQDPAMGRTGFGECGGFISLWSGDRSGRPERPELIGYPAPGYHPVEYFDGRAPWSIAPREGRFKVPAEADLRVRMWELDDGFDFVREIKIDHRSVSDKYGSVPRAVFRPAPPDGFEWKGSRVWVLLLKDDAPMWGYFVHFVSLEPESEPEPEPESDQP